jgi:hypothetical protein
MQASTHSNCGAVPIARLVGKLFRFSYRAFPSPQPCSPYRQTDLVPKVVAKGLENALVRARIFAKVC